MSYEEISAELDQKFTELGQNFGRVRPKIGPELGVKFSKKTLSIVPCYCCDSFSSAFTTGTFVVIWAYKT